MNSQMTLCIDPGHGMSNRKSGVYDTGAAVCTRRGVAGSVDQWVYEAEIVMEFANELRQVLLGMGHQVIRTRKDALDPTPLADRAKIAKRFHCDMLISLHCNASDGRGRGTETFYRGASNKGLAQACNAAVCASLGTRNRGVKLEAQSQHARLAVLNFPRAVLIELAFIDHPEDRAALMDETKMLLAAQALAEAITS